MTRSIEFRSRKTLLNDCPQALSGVLVTLFKKQEKNYLGEAEDNAYTGVFSRGSRTVKLTETASLHLFKIYPCFSLISCVFMHYEWWVVDFLSNYNKSDTYFSDCFHSFSDLQDMKKDVKCAKIIRCS